MVDNNQENLANLLFENTGKIYEARKILGPKNEKVRKILSNQALFRQPLYSYERAVFDIWAGLKERQILNQKQISQEDLEALKTILSWISGLKREQIEAEKIIGRNSPSLFMSAQTKGSIEQRLKNLTPEKLQENTFFTEILGFFTGLVSTMNTEGLLKDPITAISDSLRVKFNENK